VQSGFLSYLYLVGVIISKLAFAHALQDADNESYPHHELHRLHFLPTFLTVVGSY